MENTNNVNEQKQELVSCEYQGAIYFITKEEFNNLKEGWVTFKEMFG